MPKREVSKSEVLDPIDALQDALPGYRLKGDVEIVEESRHAQKPSDGQIVFEASSDFYGSTWYVEGEIVQPDFFLTADSVRNF